MNGGPRKRPRPGSPSRQAERRHGIYTDDTYDNGNFEYSARALEIDLRILTKLRNDILSGALVLSHKDGQDGQSVAGHAKRDARDVAEARARTTSLSDFSRIVQGTAAPLKPYLNGFAVEAVGQIGANNSKPGPHRKTPAHLVNLDRPLEGDRSPQTAPTGTRKNSSTHDKFAKQRLPPPGAPVLVSHRAPLPSDRSPTDYGPVSGRTMMIDRPHRDDAQPLRERTVSQPIAVTRQVPVRDRRMSNTARAKSIDASANKPLLSLKADPPSKYAAVEPSRAPESAPRSAKEVADSHFRKISLSKASEVPTLRVDSVPIPTVGPDVVPPAAPALTTAAPATPANAALPDMQTVDNTMDSHVTSPPRLGVSAVIAEAPPIGPSANEPAQYVSGVQSRKSSLSSASESRLYGEEVMNCRDERAYLRPSSPPRYRSMSRQPSADSQWSGRSREGSSRLIGSRLPPEAMDLPPHLRFHPLDVRYRPPPVDQAARASPGARASSMGPPKCNPVSNGKSSSPTDALQQSDTAMQNLGREELQDRSTTPALPHYEQPDSSNKQIH